MKKIEDVKEELIANEQILSEQKKEYREQFNQPHIVEQFCKAVEILNEDNFFRLFCAVAAEHKKRCFEFKSERLEKKFGIKMR